MFKDGDREPWEGDDTSSTVVGLTDRRKYNGFVPLMDEEDPLKTAVLRILSGLQVGRCGTLSSNYHRSFYCTYCRRIVAVEILNDSGGVYGISTDVNA